MGGSERWDEPLVPGFEELPEGALDRPEYDTAFEAAVLAHCGTLLRRRRVARRALFVAAVGLVFAAGLGTGRWLQRPAAADAPAPGAGGAEAHPDEAPRDRLAVAAPPALDEPPDARPEDPARVEMRAELATGPDQALLYRAAGDAYLEEWQDVASALRCYRRYLEIGPPAGGVEEGNESWLLASLRLGL